MSYFYITTPLYYVNDKPHVGTAYSTVLADILNRYHQLFGKQTFFLTGVDEHGQKCQQAAENKGLDPQTHCDQMADAFKQSWNTLDIQYNQFYRTTHPDHQQLTQKALQKLFDSGYIYESTYEGWYSISEEIFYMEKDLVNGLSPNGKKVTKIKEKNYFFKMSQFQKPLMQHLQQNPSFIYPKNRQNEVMGFLKQGLDDLCISRPKSRLKWGVELPFNKDYVVYVWVDALLNYIFGIGCWKNPSFDQWWRESTHLIGKDILITHAVYWPCLLMAFHLPLPKQIVSHGWLLNKDQEKMSKSEGEVLDPLQLINELNSDALRYFFVKATRLGQDSPISRDLIIKEYNQDLADNLGNLLQRVIALIVSYFHSKIPAPPTTVSPIQEQALNVYTHYQKWMSDFSIHKAIFETMDVLRSANQFLEQEAPWKLVKTDRVKTGFVLYSVLDVIRICAGLLQPVIPQASKEIIHRLGFHTLSWKQIGTVNQLKEGQMIQKGLPVFPKMNSES